MLKAKTKYAIIAMIELFVNKDQCISSNNISRKYNIPLKFLEQILNDLKNAKLILSTRGANGGYQIHKAHISLKDIFYAINEQINITNCQNEQNCANNQKCNSHDIFYLLQKKMSDHIYSISLAEISSILKLNNKSNIYADYQSTTPVDEKVLSQMLPYFEQEFGNPHSRTHAFGWNAKNMVDQSRKQVAQVINAYEQDIIFTSGATEANNLAIIGSAKFYQSKKHIVTIKTEHKCVINTCLSLDNYEVSYAKINENGIVDLDSLRNEIREDTLMVSISGVNSEIGVIQPLKEIGQICAEKDVLFHSDIAQAFGKIDIDVQDMNINLASISSHKIYGPKGVGALYINRTKSSGRKRPKIRPLFFGGGQEFGLRSGTVPTPLVVGFGKAAEIASYNMKSEQDTLKKYFDQFVGMLENSLPKISINGDRVRRYHGNINVSFRGIEGESLIMALKGIAVSSGSACTSDSLETSYVLKNIGLDDYMAHSSIRFSFGRYSTIQDVKYIAEMVIKAVKSLRDDSPFWELEENGKNLNEFNWTHCH